jgi:lipopolysaccharide export system protein LptA
LNLLLADQLRGEPETSTLTASGSVETTWVPREGKGEGQSEGEGGPIEVASETLAYRGDESLMQYEGDVLAREGNRRLSCRRLTALLGEEREITHLICEHEVVLEDPVQNRTVHSDRADYDVAAEEVTFEGEPVRVTDGEGGTITGKRMIYRIPDGTVRAISADQLQEEDPE